MGISPFHFSNSSYDSPPCEKVIEKSPNYPNPNPNNYEIIRFYEYNNNLLVEIKYLDCTNYEGRKILYYENCTLADLIKQKSIDPHFSENKKYHSPIARFEPTVNGWIMAHRMF